MEARERRRHLGKRHAEGAAGGDGGERVRTLCKPGTVQGEAHIVHAKAAAGHGQLHILAANIGAGGEAEAERAAGKRVEIFGIAHHERLAGAGAQGGEHRGDLGHLLVVALQIEDHAHRRRIAHERAVALIGLDDEEVGASGPGIAGQAFGLQQGQLAAGDHRRIAAGRAQDLEHHRRHRGLAARAAHRHRAMRGDEMSEQLGAMDDGNACPLGRHHIGHLLLDRGRDDERGAIGAETRAVLRQDDDAEALELGPQLGPLAVIEGAVAAARMAALHDLDLGERAHARAAEPRIMEAAGAERVGDRRHFRRRDEHVVAFAHLREQRADIGVRQAHAAMGEGAAEQGFVIGAVQIDVTRKRIVACAPVHALLEPVEGEDAGEDEIVVARLALPHLSGRRARGEHRPGSGVRADLALHAMPAGRRAVGILLAADAVARGGDAPGGARLRILEPDGGLALHIHHEQPRRQLARGARPGKAVARERKGAGGGGWIEHRDHAAHSATAGVNGKITSRPPQCSAMARAELMRSSRVFPTCPHPRNRRLMLMT